MEPIATYEERRFFATRRFELYADKLRILFNEPQRTYGEINYSHRFIDPDYGKVFVRDGRVDAVYSVVLIFLFIVGVGSGIHFTSVLGWSVACYFVNLIPMLIVTIVYFAYPCYIECTNFTFNNVQGITIAKLGRQTTEYADFIDRVQRTIVEFQKDQAGTGG